MKPRVCQLVSLALLIAGNSLAILPVDPLPTSPRKSERGSTTITVPVTSLIGAVAKEDCENAFPVSAILAIEDGKHVARIVVASRRAPNPLGWIFQQVSSPVTPSADAECHRVDLVLLNPEERILANKMAAPSALKLVEAISLAECITTGQVLSICIIQKKGQLRFHVTVKLPDSQLLRALIDPETCSIDPIDFTKRL